jgi:hypothetical protein
MHSLTGEELDQILEQLQAEQCKLGLYHSESIKLLKIRREISELVGEEAGEKFLKDFLSLPLESLKEIRETFGALLSHSS